MQSWRMVDNEEGGWSRVKWWLRQEELEVQQLEGQVEWPLEEQTRVEKKALGEVEPEGRI